MLNCRLHAQKIKIMSAIDLKKLFIGGPSGPLEAILENLSSAPKGIMIVCHPHPLHGGTMQNKVVHTLARTGQALGLATLRFNYRGVEKSAGEYAEGVGETEDLLAIIDWLDEQFPAIPIWLAGFSFGAYVAMCASNRRHIEQLITVAPAVNLLRFEGIEQPNCPWLLLMGDADEIVPFETVLNWIDKLETAPETVYFERTSHFFHGQLINLKNKLIEKLKAAAEQL